MEQLSVLTNRKKKGLPTGQAGAKRLTKNSKIIKTIIAAIKEKKGENIVSLDLRKINEAVADFFIVCEADNQPQIKAIADNVEDKVFNSCDEKPYHHEGYRKLQWVLVDYVNVVVHIMLRENRGFYKLEDMWSDGIAEKHSENIKGFAEKPLNGND